MNISEIRVKHEHLFVWAEHAFKERCEDPNQGDPMEAAMLMEAILTSLTAIHMEQQAAELERKEGKEQRGGGAGGGPWLL